MGNIVYICRKVHILFIFLDEYVIGVIRHAWTAALTEAMCILVNKAPRKIFEPKRV
jgi:hypothetical protein